jgi:hypothetical protein
MSSQKQIDANRRNAEMSTGPNTLEGRGAVRSNALRHGLTAATAVLHNESAEDFQALLDDFRAEHQPASPTESLLVEQLAMAAWRLERLRGIETGLFELRMTDLARDLENKYHSVKERERRAFVFLDDTRNARAIQNLFRYETRIERSFYKALAELQRLRAARPSGNPPAPIPADTGHASPASRPRDDDPTEPGDTAPPRQPAALSPRRCVIPAPSDPASDSAKQSQSRIRTLQVLERTTHPHLSPLPQTCPNARPNTPDTPHAGNELFPAESPAATLYWN